MTTLGWIVVALLLCGYLVVAMFMGRLVHRLRGK